MSHQNFKTEKTKQKTVQIHKELEDQVPETGKIQTPSGRQVSNWTVFHNTDQIYS